MAPTRRRNPAPTRLVLVATLLFVQQWCQASDDQTTTTTTTTAATTNTPAPEKAGLATAAAAAKLKPRFEWVDGLPEVVRGLGETKLITACINTGDRPAEVSVSTNFSHTFELDALGFESGLADFLDETAARLGVRLTTRRGLKTMVQARVMLERRTKAVVLFRDNVVKLRGRARRLPAAAANLGRRHAPAQAEEAFHLTLKSTELEAATGKPLGTFSVDYFGTDLYKHPQFYNLANKLPERQFDDSPQVDGGDVVVAGGEGEGNSTNTSNKSLVVVVEGQVKSPYACAEHALSSAKQVALYDVNKMRCTLFESEPEPGAGAGAGPRGEDAAHAVAGSPARLLDRDGRPIGRYNFQPSSANLVQTSADPRQVEAWKLERKCDLIQQSAGGLFACRKFPDNEKRDVQPMVLMFRLEPAANQTDSPAPVPAGERPTGSKVK